MKIIIMIFTICCLSTLAFDEVPIPIPNHIKSSDVIAVGSFVGKNYRKLSNSDVVTEYKFKLISQFGLKLANSEKNFEFKVLHLGGVWMGKQYFSKNTPEFDMNEKVVLFLKKNKYGFWFVSPLQSRYSIIKKGRDNIMVSLAYPFHPTIGKIEFDEFNQKVIKFKGDGLSDLVRNTYGSHPSSKRKFSDIYSNPSVSVNNQPGRSIASIEDDKASVPLQNQGALDPFWILVGMGLLSGFYRIIRTS